MVFAREIATGCDRLAVRISPPAWTVLKRMNASLGILQGIAFARFRSVHYDETVMSTATATAGRIVCDGCGIGTTSEHIAKRLRRLELTTRYRPIHIQAVFLSAESPADDKAFLYGMSGGFTGEAASLLGACGIEFEGRDAETVLSEFQRRGFFLTHVLECMPEGQSMPPSQEALQKQLPAVIRKIRGSLKPKCVVPISKELGPVLSKLQAAITGAEWVSDQGKAFDLSDRTSVSKLTSELKSL